jgi:hypothetical protein
MNTYLIFFGKSQDFTFYAFDKTSYINDFNSVIRDFDELESKVFTIDDVSNKEILSKYNFNKNGKNYSLLKLYSLGQATNGSRIAGSIYGVALLSEKEIELTESNNAILNVVKKNFASLCLDGAKFKMSDFYSQAETIWKAIINHKDGNYFDKIIYRNGNFNTNNKVKAFCINDILKNSFEVNNEINNASRLYFSNDLEHLKRTQGKWGKDTFPIFVKENNQYILYTEKPKFTPKPDDGKQDPEISELRFRNAELRNELSEFERKYRNFKHKASKNFKIASIFAVVFCLSTLAFFFKSVFLDNTEDNSSNNVPTEQTTDNDNGGENATEQQTNQINLNDILVNDDNRNTLNTLLQNIKEYEKSINKKIYSDAIIRDANILGLDKSFIEKYEIKQDENSRLPENENNKKNDVSPLPNKKETQKVDVKKDAIKKVEPKKVDIKKDEPKKVEIKKEEPKKEEPKKEEPKKEEPKKEEPKRKSNY